MKNWFRTSDKLPSEDDLVLIETICDEMLVATYKYKEYEYWRGCVFEDKDDLDWELCEVVRWMYIPEE